MNVKLFGRVVAPYGRRQLFVLASSVGADRRTQGQKTRAGASLSNVNPIPIPQ